MSDSSYSYIDAPASAIELNTNKISEISESEVYDKEYPNAEAVKDYVAEHSGGEDVEHTTNKVTSVTAQSTDIQYPSAKAVYTELDKKLDKAGGTMSGNVDFGNTYHITGLDAPNNDHDATNKKYVDSADALAEKIANKVTSISSASTDTQYASAKCTYDNLQLKENAANKVTEINEQSTDTQYPSAKCVYDGIAGVASDFSQVLETVEFVSHKVTEFTGEETDTQYPSAKLVYDVLIDLAGQFDTALGAKEDTENKVTSLSAQSSDTEYPSAKCVYDAIANALIVDTNSEVV